MGVANFGTLDRLDAPRELIEVLADREAVPDRATRHPAVVADPIDRAHRPLLVVLLSPGEQGGCFRKLQLEKVLAMPDPFQLGGELRRLAVRCRTLAEAIDRA